MKTGVVIAISVAATLTAIAIAARVPMARKALLAG